jgi:YggT family protein
LLTIFLVILVARAILSWFPVNPNSPLASINRILLDITEPIMAPIRRVIPPAGMFDMSFLVVFIVLLVLRSILCGGGFF